MSTATKIYWKGEYEELEKLADIRAQKFYEKRKIDMFNIPQPTDEATNSQKKLNLWIDGGNTSPAWFSTVEMKHQRLRTLNSAIHDNEADIPLTESVE